MKASILLLLSALWAQADFKGEWAAVSKEATADAKEQFLTDNEAKFGKDPDFWVVRANVAWNRNQGIRIERGEPGKGDFRIEQVEGDGVGRITQGKPRSGDVDEAVSHLGRALELAPDRIDIRRGRLDLLHWANRPEQFLKEAEAFAKAAAARREPFRTKENVAVEESAAATAVGAMQDFFGDYYKLETEEGDEMLFKIATLMVEHFPQDVIGYNDLALYYDLKKKPELVIANLEKASRIAPDDVIVAMNYAETLRRNGKSKQARGVLTKILASKSLDADDRGRLEKLLAEVRKADE